MFLMIRVQLKDMDNIEQSYFENGGIFLVMLNNGEMIGTGAIRKLEERVCELKRLWLLIEYHGKGLGYRMIMELLRIAREMGYQKVRLETDPVYQKHAIDFYIRLGFYPIPHYDPSDGTDIAMELVL